MLDPASTVPDFSKMTRQEAELWVRERGRWRGGEKEEREEEGGEGGESREEEGRGRGGEEKGGNAEKKRGCEGIYMYICRAMSKMGRGVESRCRNDIAFSFLQLSLQGHCSALIKLLPGYEDVFAAHSSWFTYSAMLRIYKHYNFVLNDKRYGEGEGQPYLGNRASILGLATRERQPSAPAPSHPFPLSPPHPPPIPFPLLSSPSHPLLPL